MVALKILSFYDRPGVRVHGQAAAQFGVVQLPLRLPPLPRPVVPAGGAPRDGDGVPVRRRAPLAARQLTLRVEPEQLRAAVSVAPAHPHLAGRVAAEGVQTGAGARVLQLSPEFVGWQPRVLVKHIVSNFFHEPIKTFTILLFLHL